MEEKPTIDSNQQGEPEAAKAASIGKQNLNAQKKSQSCLPKLIVRPTCTTNIPKSPMTFREKSNLSSKLVGRVPPPDKMFTLKKRSKTNIGMPSETESIQSARPKSQCYSKNLLSSPSTITVGNFTHQFGVVPSYLRRNAKLASDANILAKKKAFVAKKNKLAEMQTEFLTAYKDIQNYIQKRNKSISKTDEIGQIELLALIQNDKGELLLNSNETLQVDMKKSTLELPPLPAKNVKSDDTTLEDIRKKIMLVHCCGFKLCQELVDNFENIQSSEGREAGDCSDLEKKVFQILRSMETKIVDKQEQQKVFITNFIKEVQQLVAGTTTPSETNDSLMEDYTKELNQQLGEYKQKSERAESKVKELEKKLLAETRNLKAQISERENKIKDHESKLTDKEQELTKVSSHLKTSEKKLDVKFHELAKKEGAIAKLEAEIKELRDIIKGNEMRIQELQVREEELNSVQQQLKASTKSYETERELVLKLQSNILEKDELIRRLESDVEFAGQSAEDPELLKEIESLKDKIIGLEKNIDQLQTENASLKESLDDKSNETLESNLRQASQRIEQLNETNESLRQTILNLQESLARKEDEIQELEQNLQNFSQDVRKSSNNEINEINRLRASECEKIKEIESLRTELSKARTEIKQQEETEYVHKRLLRIRSELINSLQEKEASNRCRLDDLYTEINKKTCLVNQKKLQMNHEISAKAEELQNLFSTLSTKQMEFSRQEYVIKMLEQSNERCQRLRVKQEERIAKLENENAELKHMLNLYFESSLDADKSTLQKLGKIFLSWKQRVTADFAKSKLADDFPSLIDRQND